MQGRFSHSGGNGSIQQGIAGLGKAIGLMAAIIVTPLFFLQTSDFFSYLFVFWGDGIARFLMWIIVAIEAYVIYAVVSLAFSFFVTYAVARFAAKKFFGEL